MSHHTKKYTKEFTDSVKAGRENMTAFRDGLVELGVKLTELDEASTNTLKLVSLGDRYLDLRDELGLKSGEDAWVLAGLLADSITDRFGLEGADELMKRLDPDAYAATLAAALTEE